LGRPPSVDLAHTHTPQLHTIYVKLNVEPVGVEPMAGRHTGPTHMAAPYVAYTSQLAHTLIQTKRNQNINSTRIHLMWQLHAIQTNFV